MLPPDDYSALKHYWQNQLPAVQERARCHVLLRNAGLIQQHSFSCQICRSLWRLGHSLVTAGQWLERRYEHAALGPARG